MNIEEMPTISNPGSFVDFCASQPDLDRSVALEVHSAAVFEYQKQVVAEKAGSTALSPLLESAGRNL